MVLSTQVGCRDSSKEKANTEINSTSPDQLVSNDTTARIRIDSLINKVNQQVRAAGPHSSLPFPKYNVTDTIKYWLLENKSARISSTFQLPRYLTWPTFFVHEGHLAMVRHREWVQFPGDTTAAEIMIYLDPGGDIVYCEGRESSLKNKMPPGYIRTLPFSECQKTKGELKKLYEGHWKEILLAFELAGVPLNFKSDSD